MGTCVSARRGEDDHPDSATMKVQQQDPILIPSPTKDSSKPVINGNGGVGHWQLPQSKPTFPDFGSKDETFFDSQAWLESDCEDDFMSVKGDFTPSRGSTPVHHNFSTGTPRVNGALLVDPTTPVSIPEPSPNTRKNRLSDLFNDSLRGNYDDEEQTKLSNQNGTNEKVATPYVSEANSVTSDGRTPNGDFKPEREKSMKSMQCCLPSMLSTRIYGERKTKMSPARSTGYMK